MPSLDVAINALRAEAGSKKFDRAVANIQKRAAAADGAINETDKNLNKMGGTLSRVALGMVSMAAAYKGLRLAQDAVREFALFEQQLANVSTMLDEQSMRFLPEYKTQLAALAVEFGQTTETLSKGLYDILSASVDSSKALGVLRVASKAAIGGLTTTAVAADAITTVLNAYGMEAEEATRVSDILFATVKGGKITFGELGSSIGKVVAIAATSGLGLEQVAAAIATMTRNGIQADMAMTSLKGIITTFLSPTKESQAVADKFGLTLNAATLQTLGLTGAMELLTEATAEESAAIFSNVRALLGAEATRKNIVALMKDHKAILDSTGAAQEAYAKNADTLTLALNRNKEEWKDLKRIIGEGIAPALESWLVGFSKFAAEWKAGFAAMTHDARVFAELAEQKLMPTGENIAFVEQMMAADEALKRIEVSADRAHDAVARMNQPAGAFDINAGMPSYISESPTAPVQDTKAVAKFAADQAEAYRRLFDDLGTMSQQNYDYRISLLSKEKEEYSKFIDDKVILEQWFMERKKELDLQRDIDSDNFRAGFSASIEQMKQDTMSWGEVGQQTAQDMKSAFASTTKNMIMNGATLKEAMHGFAMSMLSSFIDVITQMIAMKAMASAFGVGAPVAGGGLFGAPTVASAKGNIFTTGVRAFKKGSAIIGQPTLFPMANGGVGLAGETGKEAIMPLGRDSQGNLGVRGSGESESKTPVKIVNVLDSSMFEEYLNSGAGERVVMNIMQRNNAGASAFV